MKQAIAPVKLGNVSRLCPYLTDKLWISQLNYFYVPSKLLQVTNCIPHRKRGP